MNHFYKKFRCYNFRSHIILFALFWSKIVFCVLCSSISISGWNTCWTTEMIRSDMHFFARLFSILEAAIDIGSSMPWYRHYYRCHENTFNRVQSQRYAQYTILLIFPFMLSLYLFLQWVPILCGFRLHELLKIGVEWGSITI